MPSPHRLLRSLLPIAAAVFLAACAQRAPAPEYDLLIRGGTVYDGSGGPPYVADLAVDGDRIVAIGRLDGAPGQVN